MPHAGVNEMKKIARQSRIDIIKMLTEAGSGHPGGSLSAIDIVTALYFGHMRHDPKNPAWPERDRFVISKGHGVPALYATLAAAGYFDKDLLLTLRKLESPLQGHPDRVRLAGIEASTGALGQGLSIAVGMALAAKIDKAAWRTYCLIGDGESQEGQIWEAAMSASKFGLDNLVCILDNNKGQIDGFVEDIMPLEPIADKWTAFGWNVIKVDGHCIGDLLKAFELAETVKGKPTFILADTVKGKGVSFMEGLIKWHGAAPSKEECEQAVAELQAAK
jgi:transketolase